MRTSRTDSRGPRRAVRGLALALCACALLVPSTADAAVRSEFYGIVQGQFDAEGQLDDTDLKGMEANKVRTDRFELGWRSAQPSKSGFHWGPSDHFVGALATHGIRAVPFIWKSPAWVAKNPSVPPIDTPAHKQAWRDFLKAAVARYGPGGSYWGSPYHDEYGAGATPLPIQSWQIWNEPNLRKFFDPGVTNAQLARKYGELLKISHAAIKSEDPGANVVLAGNPGYPPSGGPHAWEFLNQLYNQVPGAKQYFEVSALHPYASDLHHVRFEIEKLRGVMNDHGDRAKPLWITEIGWGSDPRDQFGINQGLTGQQQLLTQTYRMVLANRSAWNIQRIFWFLWRDPDPNSPFARRCSFCASAGLLRYNRTKKPSFNAFTSFSADSTPPTAFFDSGPDQDSLINDPTPSFSFRSDEQGTTFQCRVDGAAFHACGANTTLAKLSDGEHTLYVKAVDAAGNESPTRIRSFTVDTTAPRVTITSGPATGSATQSRSASFAFTIDDPGATVSCQLENNGFSPCGSPYNTPTLNDGTHAFQVRARDAAGNVGGAGRIWFIDNVAPTATITSGSPDSANPRPTFTFAADEAGVGFQCQLDAGGLAPCSSPYSIDDRLSNAEHTFQVVPTDRAGNVGPASSVTWTVDAPPVDVRIDSGPGPHSVIADPTPSFSYSSSDDLASFKCRVGGSAAPWADCGSGPAGAFTTSRLRDGGHLFTVMAVDGPDSQTASRYFTVDTTGPTTTISSGPRDGSASSDRSPSFGFTAGEPGATFRCRLDAHDSVPCSSPRPLGPLADGHHVFAVRAIDSLGNRGPATSRSFTIDTAAPRLRIKGPSQVETSDRRASAVFLLRASEQVHRECRITSKQYEPCPERYRTPKLDKGPHTLRVRATDRAGNVTNREKRFEIVSKR